MKKKTKRQLQFDSILLQGAMDLVEYLRLQKQWSEIVFGEGPRTEGVCRHIELELKEIRANPGDIFEWIDVAILALDGAWRAGYTPEQVCKAMLDKQQENFQRKWHSGNGRENKPIVHIKESK